MTRINLVPPYEMNKVHVLAELRELPRIFSYVRKYGIKKERISNKYCLGAGHVLFFTDKLMFLIKRYNYLYEFAIKNKLNFNYIPEHLSFEYCDILSSKEQIEWLPTEEEILISKERLLYKISLKPDWYRQRNWVFN